jgi:hypothetical protein
MSLENQLSIEGPWEHHGYFLSRQYYYGSLHALKGNVNQSDFIGESQMNPKHPFLKIRELTHHTKKPDDLFLEVATQLTFVPSDQLLTFKDILLNDTWQTYSAIELQRSWHIIVYGLDAEGNDNFVELDLRKA